MGKWDEPEAPKCGAATRGGGLCKRPAGWGTDHVGVGTCKVHGGMHGVGIRASARRALEHLTGEPARVSPMEALLMCVRIAAAEVRFYTDKIAELEEPDVTFRPTETVTEPHVNQDLDYVVLDKVTTYQTQLNNWIVWRQQATDRLSRYAKMALDAGVEERLVRVAEGLGERIAVALEAILDELQLTDEQKQLAPAVVRRHLIALEGNGAA